MATNTDTHVSRVILDTKEAKDKLNELQNKLKDLLKKVKTFHLMNLLIKNFLL